MAVPDLLASVGGNAFPDRRDALMKMLDIDPGWRMHMVSDGERRRVQLAMGLLRPWSVLLLDEITVDLDLLTRARLLAWLKRESVTGCGGRGARATIVYATHVFGAGQGGWATHLVRMHLGAIKEWGPVERYLPPSPSSSSSSAAPGKKDAVAAAENAEEEEEFAQDDGGLGGLVLRWLKEDLDHRGPRDRARGGQGKTYQSLEGKGGYGFEKYVSE